MAKNVSDFTQNCTFLWLIFEKFLGEDPPDPPTLVSILCGPFDFK